METNELFTQYLTRASTKGINLLNIVAKQYEFIEALDTDVGRKLSHELFELHDFLLEKIYNDVATESEKAEFRVVKKMIQLFAKRVYAYTQAIAKIETQVTSREK